MVKTMDDTKHTVSYDNFSIEVSEFKGERTIDICRCDKDGKYYDGLCFKHGDQAPAVAFLKQMADLLGVTDGVKK